jgi:hypothetical protein
MAAFKQPDFMQRQEAAAEARNIGWKDIALRLLTRHWRKLCQSERRALPSAVRSRLPARSKGRRRKLARPHGRSRPNAAIEAERVKAESAIRDRALQAEQKAARDARYAARKSRSKRR